MELHPLTFDVTSHTWSGPLPSMDSARTLVLAIGAPAPSAMEDLRRAFPQGIVVGCGATSPSMTDLTVTVARFDSARIANVSVPSALETGYAAQAILRGLAPHGPEDLRAVLVLGMSTGIDDVVRQLQIAMPSVAVAGEQPEGVDAWVHGSSDAAVPAGGLLAIGLYGHSLVVPDPPESAPDLLLVTLGEADPSVDPDARLVVRTTTYDLRSRTWSDPLPVELDSPRTLVLVFGSPEFAENRAPLFELSVAFPRSKVLGCSAAGEISGVEVRDGILSVAVARFIHTDVVLASADVHDLADSREAGHRLAAALQRDDTRLVFVLSEGAKVDGAELVAGLCEALPPDVPVSGGFAGDGNRFRKTWILFDGELRGGRVVAAALCGDHVVAGHGSSGGWDPFGPEHRVTRSVGAVVYELDGRPALTVYSEDLGAKAGELPGSALPFPLAVRKPGATPDGDQVLFRTLLSTDERDGSLTFAADVPEGTVATLMRAEWTRLVDSAQDAAAATLSAPLASDELAIAVSGVGRRSVLGTRTADEVLAVRGRLPRASIIGFYGYGELCTAGGGRTEIQNHTMTLTTLAESPVAVLGRLQPDGNRPVPTPAPAPHLIPRSLAVETFANVPGTGWTRPMLPAMDSDRTLVLAVGGADPSHPELVRSLRRVYPRSHLVGWSAPGEQRLSVVVARFVRTLVVSARVPVEDPARTYDAGRRLASALLRQSGPSTVRLVLVAGRAREVRSVELLRGVHDVLGASVPVLGGLASADEGAPWLVSGADAVAGSVVAVAMCGDHLAVSLAVRGGIDPYPPEREVTRTAGTVLYELDGRPALSVFRSQLGPGLEGPPTGQWFGLWVTGTEPDEIHRVVAVDESTRSVALDRALPPSARVHLVRDPRTWLIAEARSAAAASRGGIPDALRESVALALAVGGAVLGADGRPVRRELAAVAEALAAGTPLLAWTTEQVLASAGELGPDAPVGVLTLAESALPLPLPTAAPDGRTPQPSGARNTPKPSSGDEPLSTDELTGEVPLYGTPTPVSYHPTAPPLSGTRLGGRPDLKEEAAARPAVVRGQGENGTPAGVSRAADPPDVSRRTLGGVEVITIGARITEAFPGEKLGRDLSGTVILDLGRVERITSFGVREWLAMLRGCRDQVDGLYLIRCTEPFVNQLTMIRGFVGHGVVVSFYAPYVCNDCATTYSALLDAERDRADLQAMTAPKTWCPRCAGPGTFDDEEGSYFSVLGQLAESVPPQIRRTLSALDPVVAVDMVEKRVDGEVTRISVHVPTDGSLRWSQILEGSEGKLVIDFTRSTTATVEGAEILERAVRRVGEDLESVSLVATPKWVASRLLGATGLPPLEVWSVLAEAHCTTCDAARTPLVKVAEHTASLERGEDPAIPCPRCGAPLSFEPSRALLRLVILHGRPGDRTAEIPRAKLGELQGPPTLAESESVRRSVPVNLPRTPAPAPESSRNLMAAAMVGWSAAMFALAVVGLVVAAGFAAWVVWVQPLQRQAADQRAVEGGMEEVLPPVSVPPVWTEQRMNLDDPTIVWLVGHATAMPSEEAAMARAQDDAVAVLLGQLLIDLAHSRIHDFAAHQVPSQLGNDDVARVARRYRGQMGEASMPQRVDQFARKTAYGIEAWGRYELSRGTYDELMAHYGRAQLVQGAWVAPFFPLLEATVRTSAEVWVLAVENNPSKRARVNPGELIRTVDNEPINSVDGYVRIVDDHWKKARRGGSVVLELENNGATRQVSLVKP